MADPATGYCLECYRWRKVDERGVCRVCEQEEEVEHRLATLPANGDSYLSAGV